MINILELIKIFEIIKNKKYKGMKILYNFEINNGFRIFIYK